ncbi:hypothetical protein CEXT_56641 [Caerostris extrusa]|uniref:Uncharacterized protein n=1 Tax=Caerostris extrusa TaxID=172846 RepID=A0AAV4UM26_CAEEX|nr:hypothetical protein CEXT_56641 [Caerostris extrusa]
MCHGQTHRVSDGCPISLAATIYMGDSNSAGLHTHVYTHLNQAFINGKPHTFLNGKTTFLNGKPHPHLLRSAVVNHTYTNPYPHLPDGDKVLNKISNNDNPYLLLCYTVVNHTSTNSKPHIHQCISTNGKHIPIILLVILYKPHSNEAHDDNGDLPYDDYFIYDIH